MAIRPTEKYGKQSAVLDREHLNGLENAVRQFLDDRRVQRAKQDSGYLESEEFQSAQYKPVPAILRREFHKKDALKLSEFAEGSFGQWVCLLEFLLRMTGKEIIFNTPAWDAFQEKILTLSPLHETLKFLKEGLVHNGRITSRAHLWAGRTSFTSIQSQIGSTAEQCTVLMVQPAVLCTVKDGGGTRPAIIRELHRVAAALGVTFTASAKAVPEEKLCRHYAHQYSLQELVFHYGHQPDRPDIMRRAIEGLDWTLRRLALFTRDRAQQLLHNSSSPDMHHMTVVMDSTPTVSGKHNQVQFELAGTAPVTLGRLRPAAIGFDASKSLPVTDSIGPDELGRWMENGPEGQRPIDVVMRTIASRNDADAHRYWKAGELASRGGEHWRKAGKQSSQGRWF